MDDPEPGRRTHNKTDACVQEEHNSLVEGGGLLCFAAADESPKDVINKYQFHFFIVSCLIRPHIIHRRTIFLQKNTVI